MLIMWCGVDLLCFLCLFFFFKQKTAYEMRISDWSSDVCSSDLVMIDHCRHLVVRADLQEVGLELVAFADVDRDDVVGQPRLLEEDMDLEIGRASCRERVCQYV